MALEINFVCYNNVSLYDIKNFHLIGISMCGLCLCEMSVYAFGYTISRRLKQKHGCTLIGFVGWEAHTNFWPYVSTCAHGCLHSLLFVYECSVVVVKLILPKTPKVVTGQPFLVLTSKPITWFVMSVRRAFYHMFVLHISYPTFFPWPFF